MISIVRGRRRTPPDLMTTRLRLVPVTERLVQAEGSGGSIFRRAVGARVPPDWPPEHWEPHVHAHILAQFRTHPHSVGWHRFVCLREKLPWVVGCLGAFPCAAGDVEIGYSVVGSYQRQGLGTEAAQAFVGWLLAQPQVHSVSAQTFLTLPHSVKVMERCGMRHVGDGDEAGTVRYRRWK